MPEYLGGTAGEWHIHNVGKNPKINLGVGWNKKLVQNEDTKNWKLCEEAITILDDLKKQGKDIPNYVALRKAIVQLQGNYNKPEVGKGKGDIALWTKEAQEMAQAHINSSEFQKWLKDSKHHGSR